MLHITADSLGGFAASTLPRRRPKLRKRWLAAGLLLTLALAAYLGKDRYSNHVADLSRRIIGDEATARVESWYFAAQDRFDQLHYRVAGGETVPFAIGEALSSPGPSLERYAAADWGIPARRAVTNENVFIDFKPLKFRPLAPPETKALRSDLQRGEGVWTSTGLPHSTADESIMAKTFIRPDPARPYAQVGVLLLDKQRIRLHITGGTEDPGGDLGIKGPGVIPESDRKDLLAAWNGGFKGPHGGYGMIADGKQYRPLRGGYASIAVMKDGTFKMGEWGRDLAWSPDMVAVRQNAVLLVDNCEVSKRTNEGNNTWGYVQVNSADFITWRSAVGLTANGDLLVASGNSLSAATLARALWAAGACTAMQLDINTPYVLTSLFFPLEDGSLRRARFMDAMSDNPGRFLSVQARDFMYATLAPLTP